VDAGQIPSVAALLSAKAIVDVVDTTGATPLHYAAMLDDLKIARLLLDAGASTAVKDGDGAVPAGLASSRELKEMLAGTRPGAHEEKGERKAEEG
jgi:ankyrin repeat protein